MSIDIIFNWFQKYGEVLIFNLVNLTNSFPVQEKRTGLIHYAIPLRVNYIFKSYDCYRINIEIRKRSFMFSQKLVRTKYKHPTRAGIKFRIVFNWTIFISTLERSFCHFLNIENKRLTLNGPQ